MMELYYYLIILVLFVLFFVQTVRLAGLKKELSLIEEDIHNSKWLPTQPLIIEKHDLNKVKFQVMFSEQDLINMRLYKYNDENNMRKKRIINYFAHEFTALIEKENIINISEDINLNKKYTLEFYIKKK